MAKLRSRPLSKSKRSAFHNRSLAASIVVFVTYIRPTAVNGLNGYQAAMLLTKRHRTSGVWDTLLRVLEIWEDSWWQIELPVRCSLEASMICTSSTLRQDPLAWGYFSHSFIKNICLKGLGKVWKMTPRLCACAVVITLETQKCRKKAPRFVEFNFFTNRNRRKRFSQNEKRRADLKKPFLKILIFACGLSYGLSNLVMILPRLFEFERQ